MNKLFTLLFAVPVIISTLFACSSTFDEQQARDMLESAVFSPEQAFKKHKTFYIKAERMIDESSEAGAYIGGLNEKAYGENSLFQNKVVRELYFQDDKFRLSCYVESLTLPLELHIIFDGGTLRFVSNFAPKDSMDMTFEQAKDYIGFPGPDFFKRLRGRYEQSGKQIRYRHAGVQKYGGYSCNVIEMRQEGAESGKAVFFIDRKTGIVVKTEWPGIFNSSAVVRKIEKIKGEKIPVFAEVFYGKYFTEIVKYSVKADEYIHPDIFNEENILLPLRSVYKEGRFLREKPQQRRARTRAVLDSVLSFDFVLQNMHLEDAGETGILGSEDESIVLPVLEKRFIPDNFKDYIIPIATLQNPEPEPEPVKKKTPPARKPVKKKPAAPAPAPANDNDETDSLEYSPKDVYQSIEAELENMKTSDPEGYENMKKIIEEMKAKEANIQNMQ